MSTKIEWTDITDNIIVAKGGGWWCRKISDGCTHCYAAKLNQSDYFHGNKLPYSGEPPELLLKAEIIDSWARQRVAKRHFVASMTDVFGEWVPREWQFKMLDGMRAAPLQTFQVLTKRADVMLDAVTAWCASRELFGLPPNVWPMVTAENQEQADKRIPYLLKVPALIRGLSVEPILGRVDVGRFLCCPWCAREQPKTDGKGTTWHDLDGVPIPCPTPETGRGAAVNNIAWVIVGGESGPGARPCDISNIRSIVEQCRGAGVACFTKQLGARAYESAKHEGGTSYFLHLKDRKGGDIEEFPEDLRVRHLPV